MSEQHPARPDGPNDKRLVRRTDQAMVAGVAAGLADYLRIDPAIVRLGFVALSFFGGSGIVLYVVMWVIVPKPEQVAAPPRDVAKSNVDDMAGEARRAARSVRNAFSGGGAEDQPSGDAGQGPDNR